MVIVDREMSGTFGKRECQPTGGGCLSEQDVRYGVPALFPGIPLYQDSRYIFLLPGNGKRLAGY